MQYRRCYKKPRVLKNGYLRNWVIIIIRVHGAEGYIRLFQPESLASIFFVMLYIDDRLNFVWVLQVVRFETKG